MLQREPARILFHLNGYTKVLLERTEGSGMADGGIVWDIPTTAIPAHLRQIGCRFLIEDAGDGGCESGGVCGAGDGLVIRELEE